MPDLGLEPNDLRIFLEKALTSTMLAHTAEELDILRKEQAEYDNLHIAGDDIILLGRIIQIIAANTQNCGLKGRSTEIVAGSLCGKRPQRYSTLSSANVGIMVLQKLLLSKPAKYWAIKAGDELLECTCEPAMESYSLTTFTLFRFWSLGSATPTTFPSTAATRWHS
ncbi:hypothetical protein CERZMDRAFT_96088 [Cercospora zeae-maydis SCOH1-5]|uniref:Uncharacterized protein n=1 Tax=Cercospora zeae-maydis SCOH1-5 TaxID=717836 RepID=A0A6A6FL13_9PEZI|nr:hypothetical protein CERZMDRAFT_96088 [Cercospora zeae-maydis SCOH1-5]